MFNTKHIILFGLFLLQPYISHTQCDVEVSVPMNIVICEPGNVDLIGMISGSESCFNWTSDQGYFEDSDTDPNVFVDVETNFIFTAFGSIPGPNLIINGDFEGGDSGFSTDYYSGMSGCTPNCCGFLECEGAYDVMANPNDGHTNFDPCAPCEGGLQMVVNGAPSFQQIWCQDVDVEINKKYLFSILAQSVNPGSPAQLQFSIDGNDIGNGLSLSSSTCSCESIEEYWVSDQTGSVEICVLNGNTAAGGNDFAIDDIRFQELCSDTAHINVKVGDLEIDPAFPLELTCIQTEVLLDAGQTGSFAPFDFIWVSADGWTIDDVGDGQAYVYSPGDYSVVVTDAFGCSLEAFFEVNVDMNPPMVDLFPPNPIIECGDNFVEVYNDDHDPDYSYDWEFDGINYGQLTFLQADAPGLYSVTVTDDFTGCTAISEIYIDLDADAPTVTIDFTNDIGCGDPTSTLSFNSPDNITDFNWFDFNDQPLNSNTPTVSEGGFYYITVTSINGCTGEAFTTIPESDFDPQYTITDPEVLTCTLTQTELDVSINGNYDLDWSGPNSFLASGSNITITEGGTYTLTISDSDCDTSISVEVIQDNDPPPLELGPVMELDCGVSSIPLSALGADPQYTYIWILPNGTPQSGFSINAGVGGTYSLIVNSANGCVSDTTFMITQAGDLPVLQLTPDTINCLNPIVNLNTAASGIYNSLEWTDINGQNLTNLLVDQQGWYYAFADNGNGCSQTDSIFILVDTLLQSPLFDYGIINCNTLSQILTDTIGLSNTWTLPDGSNQLEDSLIVTQAGIYTYLFTAENGCNGSIPIEVLEDFQEPELVDLSIDTLDCITGEAEVIMNFNGDVDSIVATQAGIEQSYFSNTLIFTQGGDVSLSFIGSNGCTEEVNFEVPVDTLIPSINLEIQNIDCNNPNGIAALLNPDSNVNYEWTNDPSSTTSFESSEQGTFTIVATDIASGCSITQDFEIEADTISPALSLVWDSLSCLNPTTTILSNPEGDYDYQWNLPNGNNAGEQDLLISETGMYMVTVTSDNGCTTAYDFEVLGDLEVPDFDIQPASTISCIETTSEINLTFNSPIISATGEIQGENIDLTTGFYETDLGGDYNITVTGENGCTEEVTLGVPVDTLAPISQVEANFINCINTAGSANVINPDSQVDYTWLDTAGNPTSGETITVNEATTLTLFSEGPNGCISENIIVIEVDTASPPVSAETTDINCIDDFSTVSVVDPIQGIEYEWTANNNFQNSELSFSTTELGIYTLTALNPENGCFSSTEVEVNGLSNLPISFDFMILEPDCGFEEFTIMGFSFEGGSEPYEYNIGNGWQNSSQEATILPGNQDISIIDANGCTLDTSIFLSVPPSLEAEIEESILVNWGESGTTELILNKPLEDIESIQWVPATGLSCDDCVSPIIDVFEDQSYTIFVVDKDGCEDVVTFRVQVQKKISVYLPNVFTPNGIDNRRFFPFGTAQHITNISDFQIFDRWGNKVFLNEEFLPNQESEGWDGTFNNQEATEGVYAYLVTINYIDGSSEVLAGDVTLIR